jgi:hypothetical protein
MHRRDQLAVPDQERSRRLTAAFGSSDANGVYRTLPRHPFGAKGVESVSSGTRSMAMSAVWAFTVTLHPWPGAVRTIACVTGASNAS